VERLSVNIITSDNKKFKNNRYTKKYARELKKAQQHLSRKQKGSNGFEKQKLKVAKIHEKIASCRLDTLHKVSKELVESYDLVLIDELKERLGMSYYMFKKQWDIKAESNNVETPRMVAASTE